MELPIELKEKIEENLKNVNIKELKEAAKNISNRYREKTENKVTNRLISNEIEAIAYSVSRMPATYGAIYQALKHCIEVLKLENNNIEIKSLLDVGAGTGAASWASLELLNIKEITCIENEGNMLKMYKKLISEKEKELKNIKYIKKNLIVDKIDCKSDLVIVSYVINEISKENIEKVLRKLIDATNKILLIIEPGTPEGFNIIKAIRKYFIKNKEKILAPCPHNLECNIDESDWCSFSIRVARSKLHRILKNGDAPYEDKKFSYIAICNDESKVNVKNIILRHPIIEKGKIKCKLCSNKGIIEEKVITKKDKELFKQIKKLNSGDILN